MSQPQVQSRPSVVSGASRRRGDRDLGNRPENFKNDHQNHRPFRPSPSVIAGTEGVGQQFVDQTNNTYPGQAGSPKPFGDNKVQASTGGESKDGGQEPLNHHLIYLTACLIGQLVEVQVKNGSIYSGVFHTARAEKDYGIVLKIARPLRDGSTRGKKDVAKDSTRRPAKTLVIQAKDLVQIIAKDVPVGAEVLQNGRARENRAEIVTDSFLSQGRHGEVERELKPWTPENDELRDLGLDSTFQNTWNRNWDQFEINKTLFGVESTFNEELYTTKLDRGAQSREREREAWRIAHEIEAQSSKNLLGAEERGEIDDFDALDEESRFSSVLRSPVDVEVTVDSNPDIFSDTTSGSSRQAAKGSLHDLSPENFHEGESRDFNKPDFTKLNEGSLSDLKVLSNDSSITLHKERLQDIAGGDSSKRVMKGGGLTSPAASMLVGDATSIQALNLDPGCPQVTEDVYREFNEFRQQENAKRGKKHREDQVNELKSFSESFKDFTAVKQPTTAIVGSNHKTGPVNTSSAFSLSVSTNTNSSVSTVIGADAESLIAASRSLSSGSSEGLTRVLSNEVDPVSDFSQTEVPVKHSSAQHSSETANTLNSAPSTTTPSSPSSSSGISTGADSSRRSTLNPNAKEFKLNPNAKSFTPSFTSLRPPSPVVQTPVYVPGVIPPAAHNMPVGVSVNSMLQPGGQSATKYTPYNPVSIAPASGLNPYLPSPGTYTPGAGVSGAAVSAVLGGGQSTIKVPLQLQQSAVGAQTYGSQQPIRFTSQAPSVTTSTYIHPSGHMYSQQMMFGQPGQVVYLQPYPQAAPIPPPQQAQTASQQAQPKHRAPGTGVQGVHLCAAPPFIAGQQHFLPQVHVPQLSNPLQPTPGVLVPTTMSAIQPPQGVIGGIVTPTQPNTGTSVVRMGGKFVGMSFQQ